MKTVKNAFMQTAVDNPWGLTVGGTLESGEEIKTRITIEPVAPVQVSDEEHCEVPLYAEQKWRAGVRLEALKAQECAVSCALLPDSVCIKDAAGNKLQNGVDYYVDPIWGAFGRTLNSRIGEKDTVYASYQYQPHRLDSVVIDGSGKCYQKKGQPNCSTPLPPELSNYESLIGNIYFDRCCPGLSDAMLFPFVEKSTCSTKSPTAEKLLPRTLQKLRSGEPVKILAWGDSVTACNFIPNESERWVNIFVEELRRRFPKSEITLVNLGWPGKAINTFHNEPEGSEYNYLEKVVNSGADMATVEFVNDAYLTNEAEFNRIYNRVRDDFNEKGIEPVFVLPHAVRPDWMGLESQKNISEDPRPYVKYLRRFATDNNFAIADVSAKFLSLWKESLPYNSLMVNNINHPDARGIKLFAETLLSLFPEK